MSSPRLLLADPDLVPSDDLRAALESAGCVLRVASGPGDARELLASEPHDVVVADRAAGGLALLEAAPSAPGAPLVVLTDGFGSIRDAVEAVRRGAIDYLSKPVGVEQVVHAIRRALEGRELREENRRLRETLDERYEFANMATRDPRVARVFETLEAIADASVNLLIEGESGTGKTMLARAVHLHSARSAGPFVDVNCGALPSTLLESELFGHVRGAFTGAVRDRAGKFEAADGGTLFLDEIATASSDLQVKLLRVLEDGRVTPVGGTRPKEVDVRLIAATNQDLEEEVAEGRFREDLYYRIHVVSVELPPLRDRPIDIPLLAERFLERFRVEHARSVEGFEPAALSRLLAHDWPGNVRQLSHAVERAVLLSTGARITAADLGEELAREPLVAATEPLRDGPAAAEPPLGPLREAMAVPERRFLERALEACGGSRKRTAELLGINRTTLFNKMKKYKLLEFPARQGADDESGGLDR